MKDKEKIAIIRDTNETWEAIEQMEKLLWKNQKTKRVEINDQEAG